MLDYSTPVGQVRLLIADLEEGNPLISDEQIAAYISMNAGSVLRAGAACLDAMATSEVLRSKVIKTQDVSADGAKVAAELRAQAVVLRARADAEEAALAVDEDDFFTFIPFAPEARLEGEEYRL